MNSQRFIELNREKWTKLQQILDIIEKHGVTKLSREELQVVGPLFRQATADLSYAQTNFADSDVVSYLNHLIARAHSHLYRTETVAAGNLLLFYLKGLPLLIYEYRKYMISAAVLLIAGIALGWVSNHYQSGLAEIAVPVEIRESVNKSIQTKDVGVQLDNTEKPVFSGLIMTNNILVSLYCLVLGLTWGIGTVFILLRNGLMLGVLADIFSSNQQSLNFWSLILPHGILELFAIVLNGGAGLLLASALVKPGDYRRKDALRVKGKPAVQIAMGSIPILIIAAVIEGFITPSRIAPWLKLCFAGVTALLLFLYIYRGIKSKHFNSAYREE